MDVSGVPGWNINFKGLGTGAAIWTAPVLYPGNTRYGNREKKMSDWSIKRLFGVDIFYEI